MSFINVGLFSGYDIDWLQELSLDGTLSWGKYNFFIDNKTSCIALDFAICLETLMNPHRTDLNAIRQPFTFFLEKERLIFLTLEPPSFRSYPSDFLKQFGYIFAHEHNLSHPKVIAKQPAHQWFVKKTMNDLRRSSKIDKTKFMSIISSSKQFSPGHAKRLEFAINLKAHFGDAIDLWGRGINEFSDKWDALAPYRYSIAMENSCFHNWMTEKLPDCYLAHTFPLYYGCPNVYDYFDDNSLIVIDIDDFPNVVRTIERLMNNPNHYESSLQNLVQQKYSYLFKYSFLPSLCTLLDNLFPFPAQAFPVSSLQVYPECFFES